MTQVKSITDDKIVELFTVDRKFIGQICRDYHVGVNRVRKVLDRHGLRDAEAVSV